MPVDVPRVVVLLASYNGMLWIEEQVSSILSQMDVDVTLYISVDRSTDGTYDWCVDLSGRQKNVLLLPYGERFGGAARNFFRLIKDVDLSDFEFVAFADQDDVWDLDKLKRAIQKLRLSNFDAYSSNVIAFWPDGKTKLLKKSQPQVEWDYLFEAAGPGCTYVLSNELALDLKRSMISDWNPLQQVTFHDWYCYAFARSRGYRWFIDPIPSMRYRQHEFNQMGANASLSTFLARYKSIRSGWWFGQVNLIVLLLGVQERRWVTERLGSISRLKMAKLAFSSRDCRRRLRDSILLFSLCCVLLIKPGRDIDVPTVIR